MVNSWTVTLEESGEDLILPLSDEIMQSAGWQVGDTLVWEKGVGDSWTLKKEKIVVYEYADFERWFDEPESYGLKSERFFDMLNNFTDHVQRNNYITRWMQAAFDAGRLPQ